MTISSVLFQILIILVVPTLSIVNHQMIEKLKEFVIEDKRRLYFQSAVNQIFLAALAVYAANSVELPIYGVGTATQLGITSAVLFLAIGFTMSYLSTRREDIDDLNPGLDLLKPTNRKEIISWVGVNMVAAVCEEIIFRSVLYFFFLETTQNHWIAAGLSALVFGFSHSVQGIMGIAITAIFGFGLQHIVLLNNGLLLASIVHFLYNMGTTYLVLKTRKNKQTTEPTEPESETQTDTYNETAE